MGPDRKAQPRKCSECDTTVPGNARANRLVCSPLCKSRRSQRLRQVFWKTCNRPGCGKKFSTRAKDQVYCGRSCARKDSRTVVHPTVPCGTCGTDTTNQKFCSTVCAARGRTAAAIQRWLDGHGSVSPDGRLSEAVKRHLVEHARNQCERCSWGEINPATGHPTLCVVRLDGDKTNTRRANLAVRCPNCASELNQLDASTIVVYRPRPGRTLAGV